MLTWKFLFVSFSLFTIVVLTPLGLAADVYTAGDASSSWTTVGYSIFTNVLYVKEDRYLQGVEQNIDFHSDGYKYWVTVIDAGTSKPISNPVGAVIMNQEIGTTTVSTGWHGVQDGLNQKLQAGHWYIIGIAVESAASKTWYYKQLPTITDFVWGEWHVNYYIDKTSPPDTNFDTINSPLQVNIRFYVTSTEITPPPPPGELTATIDSPANESWQKDDFELIYSTDASAITCKLFTQSVGRDSGFVDRGTVTCGSSKTKTITVGSDSINDFCYNQGSSKCVVKIEATDSAGNTGFNTIWLGIDYTPPTATIQSSSCAGEYFRVLWTRSDTLSGPKCNDVQYRITTASTWFSCTGETMGFFGPTSPVTTVHNQIYYFKTRAHDIAGNIGTWTSEVSTRVDKAGPYAPTLVEPIDGMYINDNTPTLWWTSHGDDGCAGIDHWEIQIDGPVRRFYSTTAIGFAVPVDLPDGSYSWQVKGIDKFGNYGGWSASETFYVDTIPPTIEDNYASDGVWVNSDQVVTLTPNDNIGIKEVKYCESSGCDPSTGTTLASPYQLFYTTNKNTIVRYQAWDNAGKPSTIGQYEVKIDKTNPTAGTYTINGKSSGIVYTNVNLNHVWSGFSDTGGSDLYSFEIWRATYSLTCDGNDMTGCNWEMQHIDKTNPSAGSWTETVTGDYWYGWHSSDNTGNWIKESALIRIIYDPTPPTRSNGKPTGTIITSSTTLSLTTDETATCKYSTTAGTSYDLMMNTFSTTGSTSHSQALSGLSDGTKNYYVRCVDLAGNNNIDDYTITFTVDITPPSTSITSVAGDTPSPYWDTTNDAQTNIVISGESGMSCRWDTTDVVYSSMSSSNECSVSGLTATCSLGSLSQGNYVRYVSCKDANGNEQITDSSKTTGNEDVSFGIDWTKPTVTYNAEESQLFNSVPKLDIDFNDNLALEDIYYQFDGSGGMWQTITIDVVGTSYTTAWTISSSVWNALTEGTHYTYFKVSDDAGNLYITPNNDAGFTIIKDTTPPSFAIQYYSDTGLTTSMGNNPKLKAGTYYIKITASESLNAAPTITINAEGTANDATNAATTLVSGNDYKYTRTITADALADGDTLEDISIIGTDVAGNPATNVNPTNEATKAAYTDTVTPTLGTYTINTKSSGPVYTNGPLNHVWSGFSDTGGLYSFEIWRATYSLTCDGNDMTGCNWEMQHIDKTNPSAGSWTETVTGDYWYGWHSSDKVGNWIHETVLFRIVYDTAPPTVKDNYAFNDVWVNTDQTVILTPSDVNLNEVKKCDSIGCDPAIGTVIASPYTISYTTKDGLDITTRYQAWDKAGNPSSIGQYNVKIDKLAPTTDITIPTEPALGWYAKDVTINLACKETIPPSGAKSECKTIFYCDNSTTLGETCAPTDGKSEILTKTFSSDGIFLARHYSSDNAGNGETVSSQIIRIDKTPPTTNVDSPAASTWFNNDFTVQYDATDANLDSCSISTKDGKGKWIEISITCGDNKLLIVTVGDGKYCAEEGKDVCRVKVYAKDKAGNENEITRSFSIDLTPPTFKSLSYSPDVIIADETDTTITASWEDLLSGLSEIKIYVDGILKQTCNTSPCRYTSKYSGGTYNYYSEARDKAGNPSTSPQQSFIVMVPEIITLKKGWNLISVTYKTFDFHSTTCDIAGKNFFNYDSIVKTWQMVKDVKSMEGGKGYWIYSDKGCEIKIVGLAQEVSVSDIQLRTGWNHVGSTATEDNFQLIKGGCTIQKILYYDSLLSDWVIVNDQSNMQKYKGYFVKASC